MIMYIHLFILQNTGPHSKTARSFCYPASLVNKDMPMAADMQSWTGLSVWLRFFR